MKKFDCRLLSMLLALCLVSGCSSGGGEEPTPPTPTPPTPPVETKLPLSLNCSITSRVTDAAYEKGDKVGLYVVNYNGESAGVLQTSGNHVNNVAFSYSDGKWNSANTLYWKDATTHADFYVYFPYNTVTDVTAHSFSVKADQSTNGSYKASEFLYGVSKNVSPTENAVNVTTNHLLSCAVIKLAAGDGFTDEELSSADMKVTVNGLKTESKINLHTGSVEAIGEAKSVVPLSENGQYKALVIPQTVTAANFIQIETSGREYKLAKEDFTFTGGKRHTFTVTVSKVSNGINVNIGAWEEDDIDNGGTAE